MLAHAIAQVPLETLRSVEHEYKETVQSIKMEAAPAPEEVHHVDALDTLARLA